MENGGPLTQIHKWTILHVNFFMHVQHYFHKFMGYMKTIFTIPRSSRPPALCAIATTAIPSKYQLTERTICIHHMIAHSNTCTGI